MTKKVLSLLLCAALLAGFAALAGCTKEPEKQEEKAYKVATNAEFEPFEFMKDGNIVGFDVDLINAIGTKIGAKMNLSNMDFNGILGAVSGGTCDIAIAGLTVTPSREASVDFSEPYFTSSQMIITLKDDTVFTGTTKAELDKQLEGKTLGVCEGFTGGGYVEGDDDMGFPGIPNATPKTYNNITLAIADLKSGKIDAVIMDARTAINAAKTDENKDVIKTIEVELTEEKYAIALKKGSTELKAQIDKALADLKADGTIDQLITDWELF